MTIYHGRGSKFTGVITHAFTGSLAGIIAAPGLANLALVITSYWFKVTGSSATAPVFQSGTTAAQLRSFGTLAAGTVFKNAPGEEIPVPAGEALDIVGGAAAGVLNGEVTYRYEDVGA